LRGIQEGNFDSKRRIIYGKHFLNVFDLRDTFKNGPCHVT